MAENYTVEIKFKSNANAIQIYDYMHQDDIHFILQATFHINLSSLVNRFEWNETCPGWDLENRTFTIKDMVEHRHDRSDPWLQQFK